MFPALDNPDFAEGGGAGGGLEGELYVVQPLDTLSDIALEFDVAVGHLMNVNDLDSDKVSPGTTLLIPDEGPRFGETVPLETDLDPDDVDGELYVVQPRESLDTIGRAFNVSVISLQLAMGLKMMSLFKLDRQSLYQMMRLLMASIRHWMHQIWQKVVVLAGV